MTSFNFTLDDNTVKRVTAIYSRFGLDIVSALKRFIAISVEYEDIPLEMKIKKTSLEEGRKAFYELRKQAQNSNLEMTQEDINAEISAYRFENAKKSSN